MPKSLCTTSKPHHERHVKPHLGTFAVARYDVSRRKPGIPKEVPPSVHRSIKPLPGRAPREVGVHGDIDDRLGKQTEGPELMMMRVHQVIDPTPVHHPRYIPSRRDLGHRLERRVERPVPDQRVPIRRHVGRRRVGHIEWQVPIRRYVGRRLEGRTERSCLRAPR